MAFNDGDAEEDEDAPVPVPVIIIVELGFCCAVDETLTDPFADAV